MTTISLKNVRVFSLLGGILVTMCTLSTSPVSAQTKEFSFGIQEKRQTKILRPSILSRKDWNVNKPAGKAAKHKPRFLTIHHTGTPQKSDLSIVQKMRGLQNFSQNEGKLASGKSKPAWFDVPYHYYIAANGTIAEGRQIKYVGDTNTEYDPTGHALVVLEGTFNTEQPTAKQLESLQKMIAWLARRYKIPAAAIKGHNDYAKTACPGENLKKLFPELRQVVR